MIARLRRRSLHLKRTRKKTSPSPEERGLHLMTMRRTKRKRKSPKRKKISPSPEERGLHSLMMKMKTRRNPRKMKTKTRVEAMAVILMRKMTSWPNSRN